MGFKVQSRSINFTGPGTKSDSAAFGNKIREAGASIQAMDVHFGDKDHHLNKLAVIVKNVKPRDTFVDYDVEFELKDASGNHGQCDVTVMVVADVETI